MILELASFLGTSVGGKVLGLIGDSREAKRVEAQETRQHDHEINLANKNALVKHLELFKGKTESGKEPFMSYVIGIILLLFATTYCYATLSCFIDNPGQFIYTKDPGATSSVREFFFGAIRWDSTDNRVLGMSKAGLGFLMCYPIIFILSMVSTGNKAQR